MAHILTIAFYAALVVLVGVLIAGLVNLTRTDPNQASRSNKLMRMRVLVQAIAIALLCALGFAVGAFGG
ncbi:twin transmembrane helix small protein [Henriciella aquimarina]|uniref:twin transmembrane helix small protein n=1 Tax=Henriciella aquimarina TaxID=545261 RepID=UPI0009FFFFD0|nr:twin transmembrane helix small protein [Henriciella aquimarina]